MTGGIITGVQMTGHRHP